MQIHPLCRTCFGQNSPTGVTGRLKLLHACIHVASFPFPVLIACSKRSKWEPRNEARYMRHELYSWNIMCRIIQHPNNKYWQLLCSLCWHYCVDLLTWLATSGIQNSPINKQRMDIGVGTGGGGNILLSRLINIHTCSADRRDRSVYYVQPPPPKWNCFLRLWWMQHWTLLILTDLLGAGLPLCSKRGRELQPQLNSPISPVFYRDRHNIFICPCICLISNQASSYDLRTALSRQI